MEILNLHDQFAELVAEMDKLRTATTLIDDAARRSEAVVERGEAVLGASADLLVRVGAAVDVVATELSGEVSSLQSLKGDVGLALTQLRESLRDSLQAQSGLVAAALKEAHEAQHRDQQEASRTVQQGLQESSGSLVRAHEALAAEVRAAHEALAAEVRAANEVQLRDQQEASGHVQRGLQESSVSLVKAHDAVAATVSRAIGMASESQAEHLKRVQGAVLEDSLAARKWLAEGLSGRVGQVENRVVELSARNSKDLESLRGEVGVGLRRVMWGLVAVTVIQFVLLAIVLST